MAVLILLASQTNKDKNKEMNDFVFTSPLRGAPEPWSLRGPPLVLTEGQSQDSEENTTLFGDTYLTFFKIVVCGLFISFCKE